MYIQKNPSIASVYMVSCEANSGYCTYIKIIVTIILEEMCTHTITSVTVTLLLCLHFHKLEQHDAHSSSLYMMYCCQQETCISLFFYNKPIAVKIVSTQHLCITLFTVDSCQ